GQRGDVGSGGGLQPADVLHRGRVRLVGGTRAGGYGCARGQRLRKDIGRRGRGPRSSPACGAGRDGARSDAAPSGMTPGTAPSPTLRRTRGRWSRATESGFRSFPRLRGKAGMGAGSDAGSRGLFDLAELAVLAELFLDRRGVADHDDRQVLRVEVPARDPADL